MSTTNLAVTQDDQPVHSTPPPMGDQQFYLTLTEKEWTALERVSHLNGKKNFRRFLNAEIYKLAQSHTAALTAGDKKVHKRKNSFSIPHELVPFYEAMARMYDVSISKIIFRFIIMPHFVHTDLFLPSSSTNTGAPAFTSSVPVNYSVTPKA